MYFKHKKRFVLDIFCTNSAEMLDIFEFQQKNKKKETVEKSKIKQWKLLTKNSVGHIIDKKLVRFTIHVK